MTINQHSRRAVVGVSTISGFAVLGVLGVRNLAQAAVSATPTSSSQAALAAASSCTLTEELTQGPFWVDEKLNRSDIRTDNDTGAVQGGILLTLTITLQDASASCTPQPGMFVDIWHANAQGAYSDVSGSGNPNNIGVDWLRGYQISDDSGSVTFTTIFPGWYTSRTAHIHFRVRTTLDSNASLNFTSQLFFNSSVQDTVYATAAYTKNGTRTTNSTDSIYDDALLVPVTGNTSTGYTGTFTVGLAFDDGEPTSTSTATPTATASATPTTSASPTDTGTTTTTPTPTSTSTPINSPNPTPSTSPDVTVDARLVTAQIVRRRRHRFVKVVIKADERVTGKLRLVRHDDVLAMRIWGWLPRGRNKRLMKIPPGVAAGPARVQVNLADAAGNALISRVRVHVPSPS